jgi:hypothetical protein
MAKKHYATTRLPGGAIVKNHGSFGPTSDGIEAHRMQRYDKANRAAGVASMKATNSGSMVDHRKAAEAHKKAAGYAANAKLDDQQSAHHATAAAHEKLARESNVLTTKGRSTSFGPKGGVDHTVERKHYAAANMTRANALDATEHARKVNTPEAHTKAAMAHSRAFDAARAAGDHHGEDAHQHMVREHNQKAATLHEQAANAPTYVKEHPFGKAYQPPPGSGALSQGGHTPKTPHETTIPGAKGNMRDGGRVGMRDPVRKRLMAVKLAPSYDPTKKLPATPAGSKAFAEAEKASAHAKASPSPESHRAAGSAHNQAAMYAENNGRHHIATSRAHFEAAKSLEAGHKPQAMPSSDSSTRANAASAKTLAKPSLASHSVAAKAHLHAASVHSELATKAKAAGLHEQAGEHETLTARHTARANDHRVLASEHSHRIMKLKKLGPGQHHGAGGRFTGTPGGAK